MIKIPEKFKSFNFTLINPIGDGKNPMGLGWQKKIIRCNDPKLLEHIDAGHNYGIQMNESAIVINGQIYFLIIVDFDKKEFMDKVIGLLPETFTTSSGSPKKCYHLWFASDNNKAFKIKDENRDVLADVLGSGNQIIAPGSRHKSGSIYHITKDIPFAFIPYAELEAILKPFDKSPQKPEKPKKQYSAKEIGDDITIKILNSISLKDVLKELGVDTSKNPTGCYFHSSVGGKCLGFDDKTAHCFHCDGKWNAYSLIREAKKLSDKQTFEWFAEKAGLLDDLKKARKEYRGAQIANSRIDDNEASLFTRRGQIESFWKIHPFFFDKSKIFWAWDTENHKWILSDEVDFCNLIYEKLGIETISHKDKNELVEGFKQIGRKHRPKDAPKTWIQFKDKIYDIKTGEIFDASPTYFITNPIPWKIGDSEDTPTIDKLFSEWVSPEWIKTLYQIMAYNISPNKFMQRIIGLCGGGANGKGTFMKLNYKFLGDNNCVTSEIKNLSEDKFEPAVLYKKLLCVMGEVSYDDLKNTNMLKKLGGEDKLSFQFKGKTPFTEENTATCICLTNSMPITPDRSTGFYRKWLLIDFPNQFKQIKDNPIEKIPNQEFENLAGKCLRILKEMYENSIFENEGTFEDRAKRYEQRSNPIIHFVEEFCEEIAGENIPLREFSNACNEYLKAKHLRLVTAHQIGKILRDEGFQVGIRRIDEISSVVILNLVIKTSKTSKNLSRYLCKETIQKNPRFTSFASSEEEFSVKTEKVE